jgi:hypothetical protein
MSGKRSSLAALVLVTAVVATGAVASAGAGTGEDGNQLAGTWEVTVNRPAPLPALASLQVFTGEGSVIEAANDSATRTAAYGSWERVEGRLYAASAVFFRFDPQTGAHVATQKIDRTIRLSSDGQTWAAVAVATLFDPSGNVIASFRVPSTGERMPVDRISEEP